MKTEIFDGGFFARNREIIIRKPLEEDIPLLAEVEWIDTGFGDYQADEAISLWKTVHGYVHELAGIPLAVIDVNEDEVVGQLDIKHISTEQPEIGIVIREGYRGKGYGYKSISLFLKEVKRRIGRTTFTVKVNSENTASLKLFEKLGAKYIAEEGTTWNNYIDVIKQELEEEEINDIEKELRDRSLLKTVDNSVVKVFELHT